MQFPILDSLGDADRRRVLAGTTRRRYARREALFHEQDPGDTLHLIESGKVAVRITTRGGEQAMIDVLGPGEVVGTFAVLEDGGRRSATVQALESTETLSIERSHFQALRRAHPTIDRFVIDVLLADVRRVNTLLLEALFSSVEQRMLRRLLDLTAVYGGERTRCGPVHIALTQQDLASLAGTSRATANRVLRDLAEAGVVGLTRNRIHVLDPAALRRRVN